MSTVPLRIGLIGLGLRSGLAQHVETSETAAVVTGVCDPLPDRRRRGKEAHPEAQAFASVEELLASGVDAVLVTTPDWTHEEITVTCLRQGVPVFVDKPLAITAEGCDRVLEVARDTGTKVFVGHNMRHMPVVTAMRRLIADGEIGEVQAVWCRHFVGHGGDYYFKDWHADRRNTTGLLLQKGAHDIDVIHWLAGGRTERVNAMGALAIYGGIQSRGGQGEKLLGEWFDPTQWPPAEQTGLNDVVDVEDISMVHMQLDNGVLASYQQCHFTPDYWRNYTVIGTHGRLENFGDSEGAVIKVWNSGRSGYRLDADREVTVESESGGHGGADPRLIAEFLAFIGRGAPTQTSPVAARDAVATGCAATQSLRGGGAAVDVPGVDEATVAYFAGHQSRTGTHVV
ncbi:Gfo/Idh/MocA family protein [Nesterenkonia suensis]